MKKIITLLFIASVGFVNAQAYNGKGDTKGQVGASFQNRGTGIHASADFGLGDNMSYGFTGTYILAFQEYVPNVEPDFIDRIDIKARFNANLGNVLKLNPKMDVYPGLSLGLHNFGGHLGFRYFFTDGFGVFAEAGFPIAKYKTTAVLFEKYNNQFVLNTGISFNL